MLVFLGGLGCFVLFWGWGGNLDAEEQCWCILKGLFCFGGFLLGFVGFFSHLDIQAQMKSHLNTLYL